MKLRLKNEEWKLKYKRVRKSKYFTRINFFVLRIAANDKTARTPILKLDENVMSEDFYISAKWFKVSDMNTLVDSF